MPIAENKRRLQAVVSKRVADKVDHFADRFEVSQSRMVAIIIESCIENDKWLMEVVSSALVKKVYRAFGTKGAKDEDADSELMLE